MMLRILLIVTLSVSLITESHGKSFQEPSSFNSSLIEPSSNTSVKRIKRFMEIEDIVFNMYSYCLKNVESTLVYINALQDMKDKAIGYSTLFYRMNKKGHLDSYQLIMLAYRVQQTMESSGYQSLEQEYKSMLESVKSELPGNVRKFIWSPRTDCSIKNVHYAEYFYAGSDYFNFDKWRRRVFSREDEVYQGSWSIQTSDNGKTFSIKNNAYDEYFYVSAYEYNENRRETFTWRDKNLPSITTENGPKYYWTIKARNGNFLLKDNYYDEYLFASTYKYDSVRREVFTFMLKNEQGSKGDWKISC